MYMKNLVLNFHLLSMNIQMFTNGMSESHSSTIYLTDVSPEAFKAMINFMYSGELHMEDTMNFGTDLIHLLFLADRFGVVPLHQECCKMLLECLSEVIFLVCNPLVYMIFLSVIIMFIFFSSASVTIWFLYDRDS